VAKILGLAHTHQSSRQRNSRYAYLSSNSDVDTRASTLLTFARVEMKADGSGVFTLTRSGKVIEKIAWSDESGEKYAGMGTPRGVSLWGLPAPEDIMRAYKAQDKETPLRQRACVICHYSHGQHTRAGWLRFIEKHNNRYIQQQVELGTWHVPNAWCDNWGKVTPKWTDRRKWRYHKRKEEKALAEVKAQVDLLERTCECGAIGEWVGNLNAHHRWERNLAFDADPHREGCALIPSPPPYAGTYCGACGKETGNTYSSFCAECMDDE
jgi:hypothetical protein